MLLRRQQQESSQQGKETDCLCSCPGTPKELGRTSFRGWATHKRLHSESEPVPQVYAQRSAALLPGFRHRPARPPLQGKD